MIYKETINYWKIDKYKQKLEKKRKNYRDISNLKTIGYTSGK